MGDGETANIRMHCLYHAITGNMIQSGQNVYLHAKNAITQFTAEFLRISDIDLRYELTGDKSLILMHTLCEHYIEQLRKFNYKSIFYFAQPLKLTNPRYRQIGLA
ncbi:hypothetical protein H4R23_000655 [Coemansia sp. Cherry 401B]|nr:hypothetical protein H4R23_000655 [Coemansia sp. Cherry 401B]